MTGLVLLVGFFWVCFFLEGIRGELKGIRKAMEDGE